MYNLGMALECEPDVLSTVNVSGNSEPLYGPSFQSVARAQSVPAYLFSAE
jgi:hypothetical protein